MYSHRNQHLHPLPTVTPDTTQPQRKQHFSLLKAKSCGQRNSHLDPTGNNHPESSGLQEDHALGEHRFISSLPTACSQAHPMLALRGLIVSSPEDSCLGQGQVSHPCWAFSRAAPVSLEHPKPIPNPLPHHSQPILPGCLATGSHQSHPKVGDGCSAPLPFSS